MEIKIKTDKPYCTIHIYEGHIEYEEKIICFELIDNGYQIEINWLETPPSDIENIEKRIITLFFNRIE